MSSHIRQSPGVEIHEIDRSSYNKKTDYSIVGTASFVVGFADKGNDYTAKWINSVQTLQDEYGIPQNEPEQYFYNAISEILSKGGIAVAAKLPYDNDTNGNFISTIYDVCDGGTNTAPDAPYYPISRLDSNLTSYARIRGESSGGRMSLDVLDDCRIGNARVRLGRNKICVVDISKTNYEKTYQNTVSSRNDFGGEWTNDCLGIVPVIVTPANALYFGNNYASAFAGMTSSEISDYNVIKGIRPYSYPESKYDGSISVDGDMIDSSYQEDMESRVDGAFVTDSVSKTLARAFGEMPYTDQGHFSTDRMKQVCLVVLRAFTDGESNRIKFSVLESFSGSLDKTAREGGRSAFIDDVVNQQSKYVNVFSTVDVSMLRSLSFVAISRQTSTSLGFYVRDRVKRISYKASVIDPLTKIFDRNKDQNQTPIDIVVDGGVTSLAHLVKASGNFGSSGDECLDFTYNTRYRDYDGGHNVSDGISAWQAVARKFGDFCKNVRKDCIFLLDAPRMFCLTGDQKMVRATDIASSVEKSIIPNLKYLTGMNSSYTAGYSDWFYQTDAYSGDNIWIPPSIKMAGVYTHCDAYSHVWSAPAGLNRGRISGAFDAAYSPVDDEAGKIYQQSWNYAVNYPVWGVVAEGQKTMQISNTALDRVNVRRLMLYLEKQVVRVARHFLYEGNTAFRRQLFVDTVRPVFEQAKNGDGILDYAIRCDDSLNDAQTVDNNEMKCVIAVKPTKVIEWIRCSFIISNQSASVSEEVMK